MRKVLMVAVAGLMSITPVFAAQADSSCAARLESKDAIIAAKDAQIAALNATIETLRHSDGASSSAWTCEAVCIQSLIGKGWTPGVLQQHSVVTSGADPASAFNNMVSECQKTAQETYEQVKDRYASVELSGIVTKADMNSSEWEAKMVRSFSSNPPLRRFCFKN